MILKNSILLKLFGLNITTIILTYSSCPIDELHRHRVVHIDVEIFQKRWSWWIEYNNNIMLGR